MTEYKDIEIDFEQALNLGISISKLSLRSDLENELAPSVCSDPNITALTYLWASAICHNTQGGLRGTIQNKFYNGWDYLLRAFCIAAEGGELAMSVESTKIITEDALYKLLTRCSPDAEIKLIDLGRRAEILRQSAGEIENLFSSDILRVIVASKGMVGGPEGLYFQLSKITAFNKDPLHKKSTAFLMTAHFSGILKIKDNENIKPMIDYHRMRLFLRTGCIRIRNNDLSRRLMDRQFVIKDIEEQIRNASAEICCWIVRKLDIAFFNFDILLWALARSCCRNKPLCKSGLVESESFYEYTTKQWSGSCEFQDWCVGAKDDGYRSLWEPLILTEDY